VVQKLAEEPDAFFSRECADDTALWQPVERLMHVPRAIAHGRGQQKKFRRNTLSVAISMIG